MAAKKAKSETLTGLFVLIGLLILATIILKFGGLGGDLKNYYPLTARFENAAGIVKGAEIRLGGTVIGSVATDPVLTEDYSAEVKLDILSSIKIPKGAILTITSIGLLGDKMIQITPPKIPATTFFSSGDRVEGSSTAGLEDLQNDVGKVVDQAVTTLKTINQTAGTLNSTLNNISGSINTLNNSYLSSNNADRINRILTNLDALTLDLAATGKELPPVIADMRHTLASVQTTARSADETFETATQQLKTLKPAIDEIPPAVRALADTSRKASSAIDKLENGGGLIHTLTEDKDVAEDTKSFITNLKKYGILRYRDTVTSPEKDPRNRYKGRRR